MSLVLANPRPMTLDEAATQANAEYTACLRAAGAALTHAIRCGEALLAAKEACPRGQWEEWVEANFAAPKQARPFMRLAHYQDHLPDYETNITDSIKYLRGLPSLDGTGLPHPPEIKDEALRLCRAGMSNRQAAAMLGIGKNSVDKWVREYTGKRGADERDGGTRKRLERERAQRKAWRKEQRRKAAQRTGGSAGAAYSMVRRTAEALERAIGEAEDADLKGALNRALADIHRADDAIVEAMGWEHGQRKKAA